MQRISNQSFNLILDKIIRRIPLLEGRRQLKKRPYIKIRNYKKEIRGVFRNSENFINFFNKKCIDNLIISVTTFPARIDFFEYTLFSLINQTIRPKKIILWLSEDEFEKGKKVIPENLKKYSDFNFEIKYVQGNYRSYKKLIYALQQYPNNLIVTADDDIYYHPDWLEQLYNYHLLYPTDIISHRVYKIKFKNGYIDNYAHWKGEPDGVSFLNFPTTGGGVLYPPNSLFKDSTNHEIFMRLCPFADDTWFYVMAILNKTRIRRIPNGYQSVTNFDYVLTYKSKRIPQLWEINRNSNDSQLKGVLEYYHIYDNFYELFYEKECLPV